MSSIYLRLFTLWILFQAIDRRERLRRLAMETIDLAKDPYYMRNHLGQVRNKIFWILVCIVYYIL